MLRLFPEVANRSCEDCRRFEYDKSGKRKKKIDATPAGDVLVDVPRIPGAKLPCETRAGCPKGHWSKPRGFCERSRAAYQQFVECRAVGEFPRDALFRQLAAVIDNAERACDRAEARQNALLAAKFSLPRLL